MDVAAEFDTISTVKTRGGLSVPGPGIRSSTPLGKPSSGRGAISLIQQAQWEEARLDSFRVLLCRIELALTSRNPGMPPSTPAGDGYKPMVRGTHTTNSNACPRLANVYRCHIWIHGRPQLILVPAITARGTRGRGPTQLDDRQGHTNTCLSNVDPSPGTGRRRRAHPASDKHLGALSQQEPRPGRPPPRPGMMPSNSICERFLVWRILTRTGWEWRERAKTEAANDQCRRSHAIRVFQADTRVS